MNIGSTDDEIAAKRAKAKRYGSEPNRIAISSISAIVRSDHGERVVQLKDGVWSCTCEFFQIRRTCSHTMALRNILSEHATLAVPEL